MSIEEYLRSSPDLNQFCSQNGWIDDETLCYELMEQNQRHAVINIRFEEILMEGSGCVAARVPCYGKLKLTLNDQGYVESGERI
ncbi:hypothetical protein [Candidatus Nitrosacidococcus sp. I8]|uniref:hypothetical protein n=1 Tax=Candidatus Nitrosacidococcus sp. I8 TaxID=2942908 RepID=UPI002226D723|nr:hypothetical protein [Candidatus Nitrosacidococcus sp. I8]CAH9017580.1 hypothetical protein NURINAE_00444 [Candidatus Nitrosacidococcus sp. I8]